MIKSNHQKQAERMPGYSNDQYDEMVGDRREEEVGILLRGLGRIDKGKIPITGDNRIDMDRVLEVKEIKKVVDRLRELKIDAEWLDCNGFIPASILLGKFLR